MRGEAGAATTDRAARSRDIGFLERAFQKLLLNFTWWVNRKDVGGRHVFAGGFLGLDTSAPSIVRSLYPAAPARTGRRHRGMAFYCTTMLAMAFELAKTNPSYEDVASKFSNTRRYR